MRLSKNKIEHMSDKILKMIQEHPGIHVPAGDDLVVRCIDDTIWENMKEEDEIDAAVDEIMRQNIHEIKAEEMDVGALRNKIKREMCRKRNFIV